jgi:serine/threonine-protein kinase
MYDYGLAPDLGYFLVLEYLEGESLFRRLMRLGAFSPFHAAQLLLRALNGLGAAHAHGIIHRDLKPANLFLQNGEPPQVKLLDFGVAKLLSETGISITQTGAVLGTPEYMSPEQAFGKREVDGRADLYSVGVILFELITGQRPFLAPSPGLLLVKHKQEAPPLPSQFAPGLPREMDALILSLLEKDPRNRPSSTEEVANALRKMRAILPDMPLSSLVASSSGDTVTMDEIEIPDSDL